MKFKIDMIYVPKKYRNKKLVPRREKESYVCNICRNRFSDMKKLGVHQRICIKNTSTAVNDDQMKDFEHEVDEMTLWDEKSEHGYGCPESGATKSISQVNEKKAAKSEGKDAKVPWHDKMEHGYGCLNPHALENEMADEDEDEDEDSDEDSSGDEDEDVDEEEEAKLPWLDGVSDEYRTARLYADAGLKFLNNSDGKKYELVEPGLYRVTLMAGGPLVHVNFKVEAKDCPGAEVETFFAQMRMHPALVVDFCITLGPSHKLPHWSNADNRGCNFCTGLVHHPTEKCEKLIQRVENEDLSWLYGTDSEDDIEEDSDTDGSFDSQAEDDPLSPVEEDSDSDDDSDED